MFSTRASVLRVRRRHQAPGGVGTQQIGATPTDLCRVATVSCTACRLSAGRTVARFCALPFQRMPPHLESCNTG